MKSLLMTLLTLPVLAFSADSMQDLTCALEKSVGTSSSGKASRIIQLRHIGDNVFEWNNFVSYSRAKEYRKTWGEFLLRLQANENGIFRPHRTLMLSADKTQLIENVTGGGYPGAGAPPTRHHVYKCIEGYEFSLDLLKADVKADFDL
ncbi:MAG: hypothetical protein CME62_12135 [Halobacteriovoraceae bacterium]|nr:hypothetical protein [Halobacteriovoraceae bacterium]